MSIRFVLIHETTHQENNAIAVFEYMLFAFFCQTKVHGKDRVRFMESLVVADIAELKDNQVR